MKYFQWKKKVFAKLFTDGILSLKKEKKKVFQNIK